MNLREYEILFVTREGSLLPGARYRAYQLANALQNLGLNAQVCSFHDSLGALDGTLEQYLKIRDKLAYNLKAYRYFKKFSNPFFIIQRFNYHSLAPFIYSLLNKKNFILDLDDWEFREEIKYRFAGRWTNSKAELISRHIAKKASLCLAGSHFLFNYLKEINPNTFYFPPGIELSKYSLKKNFSTQSRILISWVGTMFREEDHLNLNYLLKIIPALRTCSKEIVLEIVGDGFWKENLAQRAKELKLENINFKGWVHPAKIPHYLEEVDIGVYPLAVRNKFTQAKFPVKLLEYMAKGIAVVASDFGEASRIIENGKDGFLVKDEKEFADKILLLAENSSLREKMGLSAREKVERDFELNQRAQELLQIVENV